MMIVQLAEPESFLKYAREVRMHCYDILIAKLLNDATSALEMAIFQFTRLPNAETLRAVNCEWMHVLRLIDQCPPLPDDDGGSRLKEAA